MLKKRMRTLIAAALLAATSATAAAQDQESGEIDVDLPERKREVEVESSPRPSVGTPGPLRVYGGFSVALGGEFKIDGEFGDEGAADADPTLGLQGGADYVIMDYFSIGGEMRFLWPKVDIAGADRDFLWDLVVKPRGRYAFGNLPLEVYGALPIGLTVPGIDGEAEGQVGWNIGLVGGANWFFTENIAVNAEMGWLMHKFGIESGPVETDWTLNQFLLLCPNFVYAL